jgi:hypothetical protein
MERSAIRGRQFSFYVAPGFHFVSSGLRRRKNKEAERRQTQCFMSARGGTQGEDQAKKDLALPLVMPGLVPGIHVFLVLCADLRRGWPEQVRP